MALPKISSPLFEITVPSTKKVVKFRPFLVKEEKILLMAQQSGEEKDVLNAIMQIINNCVQDDKFDVVSLSTFDIEYMFLKIRAKSVDNIVELSFRDNEDEKVYDFKVNLDDVEVLYDEKNNTKIEINNTSGIIMKYPSAKFADKLVGLNPTETEFKIVQICIDKIYTEDEVYSRVDISDSELEEFIDNLNMQTYNKIKEFFATMPKMIHKIEYKNSFGNDRTIELKTLSDFFTLG